MAKKLTRENKTIEQRAQLDALMCKMSEADALIQIQKEYDEWQALINYMYDVAGTLD